MINLADTLIYSIMGSKLFAFLSPTLNILHYSDLLGGLANGSEFPSTRPHYLHMLGRHDPPLSHTGSKQVKNNIFV